MQLNFFYYAKKKLAAAGKEYVTKNNINGQWDVKNVSVTLDLPKPAHRTNTGCITSLAVLDGSFIFAFFQPKYAPTLYHQNQEPKTIFHEISK
jgi:hypothetical protein